MHYTYKEVMKLLGDEAQAVPGAIVVFRDKHVTVAEVTHGGGFVVTPEGMALLASLESKPKATTAKPKGKGLVEPKSEPEVQEPPAE